MKAPEQSPDLTRDQLARCIETLRGPVSELLADIPPLIVAAVLVELLVETATLNPPDAPEIITGALQALRTLAAN